MIEILPGTSGKHLQANFIAWAPLELVGTISTCAETILPGRARRMVSISRWLCSSCVAIPTRLTGHIFQLKRYTSLEYS